MKKSDAFALVILLVVAFGAVVFLFYSENIGQAIRVQDDYSPTSFKPQFPPEALYFLQPGKYTAPDINTVGIWHLDEGTGTATADSSGNGNNGTLTNGPLWVDSDVANFALNATTLIDDGLVSYWSLDNDVYDYYGSNDGTCTNCPTRNTTDYKLGASYSFNGWQLNYYT